MKKLLPILFFSLIASFSLRAQEIVSVQEQPGIDRFILDLLLPAISIDYGVRNFKVVYTTTDAFGQPDTASGLLCVPNNANLVYPLAVYNHGTAGNREAVPSREGVGERLLPQGIAGSGFITLAPDYLGLGDSDGIHPYVHAATEASAGRDMLLAVRSWLESQGIRENGQLFLTGYSQGGHATQALHRDLETNPGDDNLTVTAATHLSGPYSISDVMRETLFQEELATLPGYIVYTYVSYNYVYGAFDSLGQAFVEPYLSPIDSFARGITSLDEFNVRLTNLLVSNNAILGDILQDSILAALETKDTSSAIVRALIDNDTYDWAPTAPTVIYYCTEDEQVPFQNAILADSVMRDNGSSSVLLESGGARNHGGCVLPAAVRTIEFFKALANIFPVSTGEVAARPEVSLAPNPVRAGDQVQLQGLPAGSYPYLLYDLSGRQLAQGQTSTDAGLRLPAQAPRGWTVLRVYLPDGSSFVRRILVQ
ncbi:hypothetical protein QWY85_20500 [Neolewinella lacunae]|uniref:Uncharacterized protein n=1 Tax=Neolewinella lacunae TaxID=1517758 RepID=A0A923PJL2_9BACT|nr:hypothetical protein [Neolewinella lacunae]MBC6993876.1 hypothetical protein [Neolewinella lacunae]MDN3637063.1 hypothetical protein [Neolewinella lacunae]